MSGGFVHLHAHSHYSLLTALGNPKHMAKTAKGQGMTALALTDFGNMHGAAEFYSACKEEGVQPILGCDVFVARRSRFDKEAMDAQSFQLVLLAKNNTGYENLLKMATEANFTGLYYKPRIDLDLLREHREGLIALSGTTNGAIAQAFIRGEGKQQAATILQEYLDIFGEDLYLELERHPNTAREFAAVEQELIALAKEQQVPLVATNNTHYCLPDDANAQDILICIRDNAQRNDPSRLTMLGDDYSLLSPERMRELFADLPEACDNTLKIAEQCQNVHLEFGKHLLPPFPTKEGETIEEKLKKECLKGVEKLYGFAPEKASTEEEKAVLDRLDYELGIINQMGFPSYFLIVWDVVKWSKEQDIAVGPGRGSAAGSLVSYLLNITNIDPLRYDLLFERFLNPERVSMPDIDIDFEDERRDEVVEYARQRYGADQVAQICTFGTMAARASVKDVGRVLGLSFAEMNSFAKLIPERPGISLEEAYEESTELQEAIQSNAVFSDTWDNARRLEGSVRHVSVHACAVVISPKALTHFTALQRAPKDEHTIITQFSAKPIEKLGLLKMDFLGLKNLSILMRTLRIIKARRGETVDLDTIPLDDQKAFQLLSKGQSTGVFQLESAGMKRYLKELKPTNLEDIIAMVSLYRPGPMEWIPHYIGGKHGKKEVEYVHEDLKPLLEKTFGIAIYQEQILQIAQEFAGFTLGQADLLRRAIGKKIASELAAQREKFLEGAKAKGYEEKLAIKIFDEVIEPFAGYGFNKSHAAGYAMIAYQTAYLKANYPTEFMTALLQSDQSNTDRVVIDIEECRSLGIDVLPPSVNESMREFTAVEEQKIRFGLRAIKGVGDSVINVLIEARGQEPFESLADFAIRCPSKILNKKALESLAKAGAMDDLGEASEIMEHFKVINDFSKSHEKTEQDEAQNSLFDMNEIGGSHELILPETAAASKMQRLQWEQETLGLYVSDHPLRGTSTYLRRKGALPLKSLEKHKGQKVTVAGICVGFRKTITKKNKKTMLFLTLEDHGGRAEATFFPKAYEANAEKIQESKEHLYWIKGRVEERGGQFQVVADELELTPLEELPESNTAPKKDAEVKLWKIFLHENISKEGAAKLHELLSVHKGACAVELHAFGNVFYLDHGIDPYPALEEAVERFGRIERVFAKE